MQWIVHQNRFASMDTKGEEEEDLHRAIILAVIPSLLESNGIPYSQCDCVMYGDRDRDRR